MVLHARLSAPHGALPPDAERHADTGRIQQAIDHCAAGRAVELRADGARRVSLSGPLALRPAPGIAAAAPAQALERRRNSRRGNMDRSRCAIVSGPAYWAPSLSIIRLKAGRVVILAV